MSSSRSVATVVLWALAFLVSACTAQYEFKKVDHDLTANDGTSLFATSFESVPTKSGEKFPLVIFPNSWALSIDYEYVKVQEYLARGGYIAMAYQTRGWFKSGGQINVAGPEDLDDAKMVVEYCIREFPNVDVDNIAFVGISYGGGIGLIAAANIPNVTAVVSMSGWMSMFDSLDWQWSPSLTWGNILNDLANLLGNPSSELRFLLDNLLNFRNVDFTINWAAQRSVTTYQKALEDRKVPVFVSNNMEDNLFHSNNELDWWRSYTGPKKIMLSQGTHAEAEAPYLIAPGLATIWGPVWKDTFDFLDYNLKKIDNGVMNEGLVKIQLQSGLLDEYIAFDDPVWPPTSGYRELKYKFGARPQGEQFGTLVNIGQAPSGEATVYYTKDVKMTTGLPVITAGLEPFLPFRLNVTTTDPNYDLIFRSQPLLRNTRVCGSIRIEGLRVVSSVDRFQVYGYAYHEPTLVNLNSVLLAHTARSEWLNATAGVPFDLLPMDFRVTCRDVPVGNRLVVGFNLHNALYGPASTDANLNVKFIQDNKATVTFPVVN